MQPNRIKESRNVVIHTRDLIQDLEEDVCSISQKEKFGSFEHGKVEQSCLPLCADVALGTAGSLVAVIP